MAVLNSIKIALYNIKQRRATSLKIFVSFVLINILLVSIISYNFAAKLQYREIIQMKSSLSYIYLMQNYDLYEEEKNFIESLEGISQIRTEKVVFYDNDFRDFKVVVNGLNHTSVGDDFFNFRFVSRSDAKIINPSEYAEFEKRFPRKNIVFGKAVANENEVVLSYEFVRKFSLDVDDILNRDISIVYTDKNEPEQREHFIVKNVKLVGVLSQEINEMLQSSYEMEIYVSSDIAEPSQILTYLFWDDLRNIEERCMEVVEYFLSRYPRPQFQSIETMQAPTNADMRFNAVMQLTSNLMPNRRVTPIYVSGADIIRYSVLTNQQELIGSIMSVIIFLLCVALFINMIATLFYDIKRKGIYFGVLKAQGMTSMRVLGIVFAELMILFLSAIVISSVLAYFLLMGIGQVTLNVINVRLLLSLSDYITVALYVFGGSTALISLLGFVLIRKQSKRNVIKLL
ncbi:MAG: ABC transporter permease [Clostridiales bacterium]|jgi:hypothetical protein|nr:ABC transporter permease [Clostridiales bacterium]